MTVSWLCLQLGSREHYAIPRVLAAQGRLAGLLTDTWISHAMAPWIRRLHPSLGSRRHEDIPDAWVWACMRGRLVRDARSRIARLDAWETIMARNAWFQDWAAGQMRRGDGGRAAGICFAYSYAARLPFREAKQRGMRCILGQIDPGPLEGEIVRERAAEYAGLEALAGSSPPARYWEEWREEVELADAILVNSAWSAELLIKGGVPETKLIEMPLAYGEAGLATSDQRLATSTSRPSPLAPRRPTGDLVVLFLGQIVLRKGVGQLFDAIRLLEKRPVRFIFAGPLGVQVPEWIRCNPGVSFTGPVDQGEAARLYRASDVLILPTLSDGFAITQLEAQAHGLPVVVSKFCGGVVREGVNGLVLDDVSPESIANALLRLVDEPGLLLRLKTGSRVDERFSLEALGNALVNVSEKT